MARTRQYLNRPIELRRVAGSCDRDDSRTCPVGGTCTGTARSSSISYVHGIPIRRDHGRPLQSERGRRFIVVVERYVRHGDESRRIRALASRDAERDGIRGLLVARDVRGVPGERMRDVPLSGAGTGTAVPTVHEPPSSWYLVSAHARAVSVTR